MHITQQLSKYRLTQTPWNLCNNNFISISRWHNY